MHFIYKFNSLMNKCTYFNCISSPLPILHEGTHNFNLVFSLVLSFISSPDCSEQQNQSVGFISNTTNYDGWDTTKFIMNACMCVCVSCFMYRFHYEHMLGFWTRTRPFSIIKAHIKDHKRRGIINIRNHNLMIIKAFFLYEITKV